VAQSGVPHIVRLLAVAGGLSAANIHYSQPLLPNIATTLGVPVDRIGFLPATTQIGFAVGILAVLPLADIVERRRLISMMLVLSAFALALQAASPTPALAFLGALLVGLFGVTPQLMTPFAAVLAPKGREGAAVGMVLSGILGGVLVSKVVAGGVTAGVGWRAIYAAASVLMLALAGLLYVLLPESRPTHRPSYRQVLLSSFQLAREEPQLRRHTLYGGLTFASFMTFWSTYAIELKEVFGYGAGIAGLFGLVGMAGAVAASVAGRQIDQGRFRFICTGAAALMIAGFALLGLGAGSVALIVVGVLLMDFGAGLSHSANQSSAFALRPDARGRVNSVYMSGYFLGGAIGTSIATLCYASGGWQATCLFGAICPAVMLVAERLNPVEQPRGAVETA
jgi:predicted MFS family arabinose efflux permease